MGKAKYVNLQRWRKRTLSTIKLKSFYGDCKTAIHPQTGHQHLCFPCFTDLECTNSFRNGEKICYHWRNGAGGSKTHALSLPFRPGRCSSILVGALSAANALVKDSIAPYNVHNVQVLVARSTTQKACFKLGHI